MPRRAPCRFALAAFLLTACVEGGSHPRPASTRDSAGVTIVESPTAAWGDTSPWQVDSTPQLSIGNEDGDDAYLFSRVAGAIRRDDGHIVVGDVFASELRIFDANGIHVGSHGRRGPGPGEFSHFNRFARCGADELWVDNSGRISIWRLDPFSFVREFTVTDDPMWPLLCFDGRAVLVQQSRGGDPDGNPPNVPYTDSLLFKVVDSTGAPRATLFTLPLWEYILVMTPEGGRGFRTPFGRNTIVQANGDRLVVGLADALRLDEYDLDGRWLRSLRGPAEDLTFTDAWREQYRTAPLAGQDSMTRVWFEAGGNPFPTHVPAYSDLLRDVDGNLWARRFDIPIDRENRWGVFAPDGYFLGHVTLPSGLEVFEIGRDYVLGTARDENDVQQVRLYRLTRDS